MSQFNRALVVESFAPCRLKLKGLLERAFPSIAVDTAGSDIHGGELLSRTHYYLALISVDLCNEGGFRLISQAHASAPPVHVVAISASCADGRFSKALSAGAEGYLLTDEDADDLLPRLRGVSRGHPPLSPQAARHLMRTYRCSPALTTTPVSDLSLKERQVLSVVAQGLRVKKIAERLNVSESTVQTHIKHIYSKLDISSRAEATIAASRIGLI